MASQIHVAQTGNDRNPGTESAPLATISQAAAIARPGDTVVVHAGTYREWVKPRRGGTSEADRIVYCAADGERPVIKGSEVVDQWERTPEGVWKTVLPGRRFGGVATTSTPSMNTWPEEGSSKPPMMRKSVVLPQPDGPRREKNSPFSMVRLTSSRA